MSGPVFDKQVKTKRTYGKPSKRNVPVKPTKTLSQIFREDNSMFMDFDLDSLIPKEPLPANIKKRKSEDGQQNSIVFKSPKPPKKIKSSTSIPSTSKESEKLKRSGTSVEEKSESDYEHNNLSQKFLESCEREDSCLTQADHCINALQDDENFIAVITNPVTCSQYIQVEQEPTVVDDTLYNLFDLAENDTPDKLRDSDARQSNANDMKALFEEDSYIFRDMDDELLRNKSSTSKATDQMAATKPTTELPKKAFYTPKLLPVSSVYFKELGPFFGLTRRHKEFILRTKGIEKLYDWQEECLGLRAIHDRSNLIYALPTSGGKTLVAEIAMLREVLCRKKNVIFVLPYVSIVQEKVQDLKPFAVEFNFSVEEYCAGKGSIPPTRRRKKNAIYICTIEKSQILLDSLHENRRLSEIGMIVVDELHMVGDSHRGHSLETLLAKTVFRKETQIQVIGMSATISNLLEIAKFLSAHVYTRNFRPVELKEYVKIGCDILSIDPKAKFISDAFKLERSNIGDDYLPPMLKRDPDHVAALVLEVIPKESCLIFCATKQYCENVAILLAGLLPNGLKDFKREEKENLIDGIKADSNGRICPILAKTIPYGIAYHHSGLTNDERKHLEDAYRLSIICIICCTSTLAAGVNLPAKRVIIRTPYVGSQFLTLSRYKQMVGRAGRAGKCEMGESILICDPKDHHKMTNLLCSKMDETVSAFVQDESGSLLRTVALNLIGTRTATSINELVEFFRCTLLYVQIDRTQKTLRQKVIKGVKELMDEKAVNFISATNQNLPASFNIIVDGVGQAVYPDDVLEVNKLGKAAVNAGMSLEDAQKIEADLTTANKNLVLSQCLHLLFIVAPVDNIDSINPDNTHYNSIIMRLDPSMTHTANVIGISEHLAMRMISRPGTIKEREKILLKRFYIALMLFELWNGKDVHEVSIKYKCNRGVVYNLLNSASSKAYSIFRFCESYEEFWCFKEILDTFSKRLSYCCSAELLPLMELPAVKIVSSLKHLKYGKYLNLFLLQGRAKLMFNAGFKTIEDVAASTPIELVQAVKNVSVRQAEKIIEGAKHSIRETIDTVQEMLEGMKDVIKPDRRKSNQPRVS